MSRIGKADLVYGEQLSVGQVLAKIDAVTLDDVAEIAAEVLTPAATTTLAVVGPFEADRDFTAAVA